MVSEQTGEKLNRILRTVAGERPDRVPVVLEYSGFAAHVTETPMAEYMKSPARATEIMIRAYNLVGGGDAMNYGTFTPYHLGSIYGAKVRVPGFDLPDNEMWQVEESELMSVADYDRILEQGWPGFFKQFMAERVFDDACPDLLPGRLEPVDILAEWDAVGMPVLSGGDVTTPIELLWGARSMNEFAMDLHTVPEKLDAVMQVMAPHLASRAVRQATARGFPAVWVGGWRGAPEMLSPAMWNRFVWPYFKTLVEEVTDAGLIALLHLDSNWGREMERFLELPAGKCIMATDGSTDLFRAKQVLGGHMCIMGDVPASMLAFGSPDEVREYCSKLVRELGPGGFILQSGCDIPANAKLENVQAMVESVLRD